MSEETKEPISKSKLYIRYGLHMVLTIGVAAGVAWFSNEVIFERAWNKQYLWYAGILLTVIALCSLLEKNNIYNSIRLVSMLSACFVVSALLLLLSDYYINLPIWLIGGIVAAALVNRNVGMLYLYYFVYHAIYLQGNWLNGLIFHFVTATLIAFLIPKMKTFLGMFYMMVFTACIVITGSVIHNRMTIEEEMLLDTFYILCTYLVCIFITMLLVKWTGLKQNVSDKAEQEVTNDYAYLDLLASQTAEQDAMLATLTKNSAEKEKLPEEETTDTGEVSVTEEEIDYSPYCNEKSELLLKLREQNKSLYAQAILVGKLASETAKSIGLNADLTKAAGLYKRIGKIRNNTETSSVDIAREHNFPEPLVQLLEQLNDNRIGQKEAAILLITDGVISYYTIVRHVQKSDIPVEKIVDTIVSKKIFQGEFNESGLSMQECYLLREKLIDLLKSQDKKRMQK